MASGFACGLFSGSINLSGTKSFVIGATGGFAVWILTYYGLSRIELAPTSKPAMPTPAFEVVSNVTTFDLTLWKQTTEGQIDRKISKAVTSTELEVRRLRDDVVIFPHRIASTSQIDPEYSSQTHSVSIEQAFGHMSENMLAWWLVFKVDKEPLYEPFHLQFNTVAWNSFQGKTKDWAAVSVIHPTRVIRMAIDFPPAKPCTRFELAEYPRQERAKREEYPNMSSAAISDEGGKFTWVITAPKLDFVYRVDWNW
jgi:hypothetical protein